MYIPDNVTEEIKKEWHSREDHQNLTMMILMGEKDPVDIPAMIRELNAEGISFFGGIFPGIISGTSNYESGAVIKAFKAPYGTIVIKKGDDFNKLGEKFTGLKQSKRMTAITLVDGLMENISQMLSGIFNLMGDQAGFWGGGGGSLSLEQAPCLFCNEGFFQDAALVCPVEYQISSGIKHGWEQIYGPVVATRTSKNTIYELNWQNAFEVYKDIVDEDSGQDIREDNFFDIAKGYPFGIYKEGYEDIVRDPLMVGEDGSLICVGEVPENTVLYILKGQQETLISSAALAAKDACKGASQPEHALVADCISRVIFLGEKFRNELEQVGLNRPPGSQSIIPEGILSLGEISAQGDGILTFFNKTIVVSSLYR